MSSTHICAEPARLRRLLEGSLPEEEQVELSRHLEGCAGCQLALERLVASQQSWADLPLRLSRDEPAEDSVAHLLEQFREGPGDARLLVIGEGPGRTEDETGRPFVGQAGELLTKILAAIDLPRDQVYICNVVKCRPPENRAPQFDEIAACVPYLFRQIELVRPKVILAMGGTAAQTMLNSKQSLGAMRNQVHRFRGIPVIVTYHPAALLRNPNWKKPTWDDVRIARQLLDR